MELPESEATSTIEVLGVSRRFGRKVVLDNVSLRVRPGEIHALLGPNGAGKTTLLRILVGHVAPDSGVVRIFGTDHSRIARELRGRMGLVPSGDRTFYLRLSGMENLAFFGRLHGMRRKAAVGRARDLLELVDLAGSANLPVGRYSHGMQKRLSVARALLTDPQLFLVDEATHDLDPEAARRVRTLFRERAAAGAAVVWATQRLDEIRGLANGVTLLNEGAIRFAGTVGELMAYAPQRAFAVQLQNGRGARQLTHVFGGVLEGKAAIAPEREAASDHYVLSLADGVDLGDAMASLLAAGIRILSCHEQQSEIEEAFLTLTRGETS